MIIFCVYVEVSAEDDGVESIKNPLEDVKAGLLDSSGQQLPLQAVHVKCKLIDLLSQVNKNNSFCFIVKYFSTLGWWQLYDLMVDLI